MRDFKNIKVAVAGTGYVGLSIATLLSQHHHVTAVDVIPEKVEKLNNKVSPIDFKDLFERYQRVGAKNGISIVNYCKINGLRRVKYIADVLRKLISGETDYIALLPMNIAK